MTSMYSIKQLIWFADLRIQDKNVFNETLEKCKSLSPNLQHEPFSCFVVLFATICIDSRMQHFIPNRLKKYYKLSVKYIDLMYSMFPDSYAVSCFITNSVASIGRLKYRMTIRCNNAKCNIPCYHHKYGESISTYRHQLRKLQQKTKLFSAEHNITITADNFIFLASNHDPAALKMQNKKWYKCGGCKSVFYCSRRC
eukprot:120171_1